MAKDEAAVALLGFTGWTAVHAALVVGARVGAVLAGKKKANEFQKSRDGGEATFIARVGKSHANCLENLPLFAAVVLVNKAFGGASLGALPTYYLFARIAQSLAHWSGVGEMHINARFGFFLAQGALLALMGKKTFEAL